VEQDYPFGTKGPSMGTPQLVEDLTLVAARLHKARRLAQLTRGELAVEAGVDPDVVERMETGRVVSDEDRDSVMAVVALHTTPTALKIPQPRAEAPSFRD